jgi:hypothetical protein
MALSHLVFLPCTAEADERSASPLVSIVNKKPFADR